MKEEKQIGFLWNLSLPLKAINESGIRLKTDVWAIFFVVRAAIEAGWSEKHDEDNRYAWVSNKYIKSQLQSLPDVADISDNALYRKIKQLEDAGLLVRKEDNKRKNKCYLSKGPSDDLLFFSEPIAKTQEVLLQNFNRGIAKTQMYNNTNDNIIKDNIPPTPLDGVSEETPKPKKEPRVKKKLNRREATDFYENEVREFLKSPSLPPEVAAAAAGRGLSPERMMDGYREIIDYMTKPTDMWPAGMWGCVLTKPVQLSFKQFCKLVLISGMTRAGIKEYLNQWENKSYDNDNIYATFIAWLKNEKAKPSPMNGNHQQPVPTTATVRPKGPHGD